MIGLKVKAVSEVNTSDFGQVMCHGELWRAKTESGLISEGASGTVKALDGMTLIISPEV